MRWKQYHGRHINILKVTKEGAFLIQNSEEFVPKLLDEVGKYDRFTSSNTSSLWKDSVRGETTIQTTYVDIISIDVITVLRIFSW